MGNTYTKIAETRNEWQRQVMSLGFPALLKKSWLNCMCDYLYFQWARIVLVVERGVDPKSRLENQVLYSQPMVDGRRAFMLRQQQSVKIWIVMQLPSNNHNSISMWRNKQDDDLEEMKELDDIRTTHKRSVARRAAKLAEAQAAAKAGTNGSACPPTLITQNATLPITKTQLWIKSVLLSFQS